MRTRIEIANLRGIREGAIDDLAPLSILVGPNNSGKSTLLEALWVHAHEGGTEAVYDLLHNRGWCGAESAKQLYFDPAKPVVVRCRQDDIDSEVSFMFSVGYSSHLDSLMEELRENDDEVAFRIEVKKDGVVREERLIGEGGTTGTCWRGEVDEPPPEPQGELICVGTVNTFGEVEDAYSAAVAKGMESHIQDLLPRLGLVDESLRILKRGDEYVLHTVATGRQAIPLYMSGDGFKRLLLIACVLAERAGQLVLLEEPEAFQHPRYLHELSALIWGAIAQGTQVVLSTHSLDLLRSLLLAERADLSQAAVFKTALRGNVLRTARISGPQAQERLGELEEDLRI
ncbi:ATP-dependent nuclease [Haliangium sp.]|uniref:ATP-dependent nuclease n=1 Tax=Haliangium sp. TaxID=2663208 RepID=UPI003D14D275